MFTPDQLSIFKEKIDGAQRIAIFGHESVDGDAIGSMLGLGGVLEQMGKDIGYFTTLTPSESFSRLPTSKISTVFDYSNNRDLIVFVDFSGYRRIPGITAGHEDYFEGKYKIVIDHHIEAEPIADLYLCEVDASSCCELVYEILSAVYPDKLGPVIATYLYLGIVTDTNNFQHGKDTVRTMNSAMGLLARGADKEKILQKVYHDNPKTILDFLKLTAGRITLTPHLCYVWYTGEEVASFGLDKEMADALLIGIMSSMKDIPVLCILRKVGDKVGGSLRSGYFPAAPGEEAKRISVQKIALSLTGGGHMYAAGFKQPAHGDFGAQIQEIVTAIEAGIAAQL